MSRAQEIDACRDWLRLHAVRTSRIHRSQRGSYHWKHEVENWRRICGKPIYIPEASFIRAAELEGFRVQFTKPAWNAFLKKFTQSAFFDFRTIVRRQRLEW
jgi:hypothetical protein